MVHIRHYIYIYVMRSINLLIPKNKKKLIFASSPSFSDNCRALFDFIYTHDIVHEYKCVWLVNSDYTLKRNYRNTIFLPVAVPFTCNWFKYLYHLFTSSYVFSTHSFFVEANPYVQKSVCIWHGTMLKCICKMNDREKNEPVKSQFKWFVSPSEYYINIVARSFGVSRDKVLNVGYPRNDLLMQENDSLSKLNIQIREGVKIVVYMPTFRRPQGGDYVDALPEAIFDIMELSNPKWLQIMNEKLYTLGLFLIVKLHPYDSLQLLPENLSNIRILLHKELLDNDVQLYHLLHYADAMITDYSSVFCDYLILDRPIGFVVTDMEQYGTKRGFVFEKPLEYLPGSIIHNAKDLMSFLQNVSGHYDVDKELRYQLTKMYNNYSDVLNSSRLLDAIGLKLMEQ